MAMDDRRVGSTSATKLENTFARRVYVVELVVDAADNDVASGDVVQLVHIPKGHVIKEAGADVITAEGDTLTFELGLYLASNDAEVDLDGFLAAADGNVAGTKLTNAEAYAATGGYRATAAVNLCARFNNAADACKIRFFALVVDFTD